MAPRSEHPTTTASHFPHHRVVIVRAAATKPRSVSRPRAVKLYYWTLGIVGLGLISLIVAPSRKWILGLATFTPAPAPASQETEVVSPSRSLIPLFQDPERAAKLALQLGLEDRYPGAQPWRNSGGDWYSSARMLTAKGMSLYRGDIDNYISCYHEGPSSRVIQKVIWKASPQNAKWETTGMTLSLFREKCRTYLAELGCPLPVGLLDQNPIMHPEHWETEAAVFDLQRNKGMFGDWWEFTVTAKK